MIVENLVPLVKPYFSFGEVHRKYPSYQLFKTLFRYRHFSQHTLLHISDTHLSNTVHAHQRQKRLESRTITQDNMRRLNTCTQNMVMNARTCREPSWGKRLSLLKLDSLQGKREKIDSISMLPVRRECVGSIWLVTALKIYFNAVFWSVLYQCTV